MATNYGILGQTADASSEVSLYTVGASKNVKVRIQVCNRAALAATYRIALVPNGGATANEDYVYYDKSLAANDSFPTEAYTLNDTDVVRVEASAATVTFVAWGIEQDVT